MKPWKWNAPSLCLSGTKDIAQPMAADHIVSPLPQRPRDGCAIIAVNPRRVQCQRHEVVEVVRQRQAAELRPRPAHRLTLHCRPPPTSMPASRAAGLGFAFVSAQPADSSHPGSRKISADAQHQNVLTAVRIGIHNGVV